ncbi:MAG: ATP-dependent Clp protease ATP-binding subunit [Ruminococcus sp.]|nr:ATP-dependent Clp protease ATP-binding subunit [Ruminococcus sp.]
MKKHSVPKWQQEISSFKGIKSTFIIEGNINDFYPLYDGGENPLAFVDLNMTLLRLFNERKEDTDYEFLFCDPATGIYNKFGDRYGNIEEMLNKYSSGTDGEPLPFGIDRLFKKSCKLDDIEQLSSVIRNAMVDTDRQKPVVVVMNFVSRYISSPSNLAPDESKMFLNLLFASLNSARINNDFNTLIMIVEKFNDLPAWFFYNNPNVRTISIPDPDKDLRTIFIDKEYLEFRDDPRLEKVKEKFIDITEGLKHRELKELRNLYQRLIAKNPETELLDAVSIYKYGIIENMWHSIDKEKIAGLEELLKQRVMGQDEAVSKTVNIVKRAVSGLSGLQHSSGQNKPRGVLFFAGPTGTGKTELTKALSEQLFGDENNCIRFDMSEFSESHAAQKLFGAPPGYVGYEAGGQLTNAIKERPFSILLFDEIEKAHPSIMDKFLQILEDGRMTDGQGNTVYFSETLIIFTSNLGITRQYIDSTGRECREQLVTPSETYEEIKPKVLSAIKDHFKPEVLNRIGNNVIVYDFIRPEAAKAIVRGQVKKINSRILKQNKITVNVTDALLELFYELASRDNVLEMGGRGIGNLMEEQFINPLAEFIFEAACDTGDTVTADAADGKVVFSKGA